MAFRLVESASDPSSTGASLRRAAACRLSRASTSMHDTLVMRCVAHSGYSLSGRGLRALAWCAPVMLMSSAGQKPRN
jgi:hypothetical protein